MNIHGSPTIEKGCLAGEEPWAAFQKQVGDLQDARVLVATAKIPSNYEDTVLKDIVDKAAKHLAEPKVSAAVQALADELEQSGGQLDRARIRALVGPFLD